MPLRCLMVDGDCTLLSRRDWTCISTNVVCVNKDDPVVPRTEKEIMHDFVKGLDQIEREALVRYLQDKRDKNLVDNGVEVCFKDRIRYYDKI